jgi:transposase
MAYITKKNVKGTTYYYAEEKAWIDGKSRRVWQKYLGTLPKIIAAVESTPLTPSFAELFDLGRPAAYHCIAKKHNIFEIVDIAFPKRKQGLPISVYLLLAAMNRGIDPVSKRSMWNWFQKTIFLRLYPDANRELLSSQRFWDHMDRLKTEKLKTTWLKIITGVLEREKIELSDVAFDGTNFYSFIGSFNSRCTIAKRGKNKQGRKNLRQISYALFCTRKDHIPLYYEVYEGNMNDAKIFPIVLDKFFKAFEQQNLNGKSMTIVFDKGNNSEDNMQNFINDSNYHFVGSVKPSEHKDISTIASTDKRLKQMSNPRLESVKAFRCKKKIYKKNLTVVVTFNNNLYTSQLMTINVEINKCIKKLSILTEKLDGRRSGKTTKGRKPTINSIEKQVSNILKGQHMKKLIEYKVSDEDNIPLLNYGLNQYKFASLCSTDLGKNVIITDNHDWSTEDIILSYRSQYVIEDIFKEMKNRKIGSWWPMYHWTDQKIYVHGFYCSLSLLLRSLVMKTVAEAGIKMSMNRLHESLSNMQEVINVYQNQKTGQSITSKMDKHQLQLLKLFEMEQYLAS